MSYNITENSAIALQPETHSTPPASHSIATPIATQTPPITRPVKRTYYDPNSSYKQNNNRFSVLSFNIWCNNNYLQERTLKVITLIKQHQPDMICLQEVTADSYQLLEKHLSSFYYLFQAFLSEQNPYGTCILCRSDSIKILQSDDNPYYYDYAQSQMSRRLIGCEVELLRFKTERGEHPKLHLMTTQLESLPENDTFRKNQFDMVQGIVKGYKNCILAGDFGVWNDHEDIERQLRRSNLKDSWVDLGCPYKLKYTYDSKRNLNAKLSKPKSANTGNCRFDRVLYHSNLFEPKTMALLGKAPVSEQVNLPASNHFGLLVEFKMT